MKKIFALIFSFIFLLNLETTKIQAQSISNTPTESTLTIKAPSAILIDYSSGKILYQKIHALKILQNNLPLWRVFCKFSLRQARKHRLSQQHKAFGLALVFALLNQHLKQLQED